MNKTICPECGHKFFSDKTSRALDMIPTGEKNAILIRTIAKKLYGSEESRTIHVMLSWVRNNKDVKNVWVLKTKNSMLIKKRGNNPKLIWKERKHAVQSAK